MKSLPVRVPVKEFSPERLDTGFYSKNYFDALSLLEQNNIETSRIGSICEPWCFGAYALCNQIEWSDSSGIPYLKAEALGSPLLNFNGLSFITKETHQLLSKSRLKAGDIVVSTSGTIGLCAVLPKEITEANSNQDTIKFNPSSAGFDNHFVATWFASKYGQVFLNREAGGAVQQHVYLSNFKRLLLPKLNKKAQAYIGEKVRQAERLRQRAREIENEANQFLSQFQPSKIVDSLRDSPRKIESRLVSAISLGPEFNRAIEGHLFFPKCQSLGFFIDKIKCGDPIRADQRVSGKYLYYGASGAIDTHDEFNFDGEYVIVAQDGSIGNACVARGKFWANNHVWILKIKEEFDADAIAAYLNDHYPYWRGMTTGSVVPKATSENVLRIPIPLGIATAKDEVGDFLRDETKFLEFSQNLTTCAKYLVEGLIEGKITENELVEAEEGLQAGEREADKQILGRITRQGMDAAHEPALFGDVDALYDALSEPSAVAGG